MPRVRLRAGLIAVVAAALGLASLGLAGAGDPARLPNMLAAPNGSGEARTYSTLGPITLDHPFFQSLGANGRSCATCHVPGDGWTLTPARVRERFEGSRGEEPLFRPFDAAVSPRADVSTLEARRAAYRLLLERGLIRVGLGVPPGAEFDVVAVDDPYRYASATELSLFRRPLPATNLVFVSTVMWDGRETSLPQGLQLNLARQADNATRGHAQATRPLTPAEQEAIVALELSLFTAQGRDAAAGELHVRARGGPRVLAGRAVQPPGGPTFTLFEAWRDEDVAARRAIARGERFFNERRFGPFDAPCAGCHDAPEVGTNFAGRMFALGVDAAVRRPPDLPLYTLRCRTTGQVVATTDPGRALVTGRCGDIGRFKIPGLRGLAGRAPYFHNGAAATLEEVVSFYDRRFGIGLTPGERADLVAFLRAL